MNPQFVRDLCLDEIFKSYSSDVDNFVELSRKDEHIVDSASAGICGFVTDTFGRQEEDEQKYFEVKNPSGEQYALVKIDKGLIPEKAETKRCDCALFNERDLCLIEFKANASSNSLYSIHVNYENAMTQLSTTLSLIKTTLSSLNKDVTSMRNVEAYICFRKGYPRQTSTQMNYRTIFAEKNNGVPLFFEGIKTF